MAAKKPSQAEPIERAFAMIEHIVREGGIMTLPGSPLERHLVGHFEWLADSEAFMFPAFGERNADGRLIAFTELSVSTTGVCFINGARIAGYLCAIDKAALEDPDDYRVAWRLWQEVLPRQRRVIENARAHSLAANRHDPGGTIAVTAGLGQSAVVVPVSGARFSHAAR